jgi:hypothetical protein
MADDTGTAEPVDPRVGHQPFAHAAMPLVLRFRAGKHPVLVPGLGISKPSRPDGRGASRT